MFCKNCGNQLSDTAKFCTKCGYRVARAPSPEPVQENSVPVQEAAPVRETVTVQSAAPVHNTAQAWENAAPQQAPAAVAAPVKPRKKISLKSLRSKMTKKVMIIGSVALVAVVALAAFNFKALANFARKTFSSPEDYYQYVEMNSLEDTAAMIAAFYDNLIYSNLDTSPKSAKAEVSVEIGEDAIDMINAYAGEDLSWLDNISVSVEGGGDSSLSSASGTLKLGEDPLITYNMVLDMEDLVMYMQVPELSDDYIEIDMAEYMDMGQGTYQEYNEMMGMIATIYEKCPDRATVNRILSRYLGAIVESINKVEKDSGKLTAERVSAKYTELEVTIDSRTLNKAIKAVLKEMKKDNDIKKIILDMEDIGDYNGEEVYEMFMEEIDSALEELESGEADLGLGDEKILMTVWVNSDGEIRGRKIEAAGAELLFAMPEDGDKYGFELSASYEGQEISLTGKGKTDGDKLDGEFAIEYAGITICDIDVDDFDTAKIKDGYVNGTFAVSPGSYVLEQMGLEGTAAFIIADYDIVLGITSGKDNVKLELGLESDDSLFAKVSMSMSTGPAKSVDTVKDSVDIEEWAESLDFDKLLDNLRNSAIPDEYIDMLEEEMLYGDIGFGAQDEADYYYDVPAAAADSDARYYF